METTKHKQHTAGAIYTVLQAAMETTKHKQHIAGAKYTVLQAAMETQNTSSILQVQKKGQLNLLEFQ
jgi:hypothetical protein